MATQGYVQLPTDAANTGKKEDHVILPGGQYREAVVIADPNTDNAYAPVDNTNGLTVNLGANNDVTVADGSDVNAGATTDVAVTGDNSGTLSAKLRGINKILANVWDSVNSRLNVYIQNATLAATQSGTWNITNVSGTVSLPTGASTAAKQPALGTAGTASSDVLTVQGITSMTALKVDGSAVTQPVSAASLPLPTGAAAKVAMSVTALQVTASGDTTLVSSGTRKLKRVEASNSHASMALTAGLKIASQNSGATFGKKYLPAAGGLAVWVFPDDYLQVTSEAITANLSAAGQVEFTAYYE